MTNDTMISDDPAAIDEQQAQYATTQVTTAEAVPTAPVEQVIPFAPMEGFVPTASVEQAEEFGPLAPIDEAIPVQQSGQAVPLAFNTLLGRHAQEAVKFVDEFDSAPDALTKLSVLVDLEEHLEDWKKLIESERAPLEHERNQDVLIGLKQFAADNDFDSVEKMLADLGIVVSPPVQNKVTAEPESPAQPDNQPKVHPNPKRKVYKFLLIGDHDNYKRGHNGSFTGQRPAWAKPYMNGKVIDPTKFRLSTADEIAAMEALVQAELDDYKPRKAKGAAALPKP